MLDEEKQKQVPQDENAEVIIKQHTRWAHLMQNKKTVGLGSLILTNRRLLFLHQVPPGPRVNESIRNLADATTEAVLDHALTLHKSSFQIPLSTIINVMVGTFFGFPLPHFYMSVTHLKLKKLTPEFVDFQFEKPAFGLYNEPQLVADLRWQTAIKKAIKEMEKRKKQE